MKIIYITNARIPTEKAHGYQICKMCEEFSDIGLEVELWIPDRENNIKVNTFSFYNIKANFKIKVIKSFDFLKWQNFLGKKAFYLQTIWFLRRLFFIKIPKGSMIYTRDAIIAFTFSLRNKRVIYEGHLWPEHKLYTYKFFLNKVTKLVVLTEGIKKLFIKHGFSKDRLLVSPDGVDLKKFDINITMEQARENFNLPKSKIILGYTGSYKTMGQEKGIMDILKALKILFKKNNEYVFVAVGGNEWDIEYYREAAKEMEILENVLLLPRVNIAELPIYQKAFNILLMPFPKEKHYAYYMSPMKMFEYMASNRPIIASDLPSIREILNEYNSILVKPNEPLDLVAAIELLTQDMNLAERISKQALYDVENYIWTKRAERILKFITRK